MANGAAGLSGTKLAPDEYFADYYRRYAEADGSRSWKLERRQSFVEPDDDSWQEFSRGNWDRALELLEGRRPRLLEYAQEDLARGIGLYRVRVVAEPLTRYLLWESNALRIRSECGEKIRVVDVSLVRELETDGELPEILTIGDAVYQVLYSAEGGISGAIRSTDAAVVENWAKLVENLYDEGEEISSFFRRKIAGRKLD